MASNHGKRSSGWDHDEYDRRRKHEKMERREEKEYDPKSERKKRSEHEQQQYGEDHRSHGRQSKRPALHRDPALAEPLDSGGGSRGSTAVSPEESPALQKSRNWRDEVQNGIDDERDFSDDEEATQRKLEESRRRREAMMAKFVPKEPGAKEGAEVPVLRAGDGGVAAARDTAPATGDAAEPSYGVAPGEPGVLERTSPAPGAEAPRTEREAAGDMFGTGAGADVGLRGGLRQSAAISLTGASGDDWDDQEGYYLAKVGEVLDGRYLVHETVCGRGVFSNVVKARDRRQEGAPPVAIKIIRSNDMMKKAAEKEIEILQKLNTTDKGDKRHIIRLLETFYYRKHIFLVFECMCDDLRAALKKHTKNKGMALQAVRVYAKQLLVGVRHMHRCEIIHADIKPDNILISDDNSIVKLCDLGTAVELKDATISPYLMSRFYRPPEVILGCEYGIAVDIWALSCTLYEVFTGKTLLMGKTNNDQLKRIMDLKGKVPGKVIKKGAVWQQHFDENLEFKYEDTDKMTGEKVMRILTDLNAKRDLKDHILEHVGSAKRQSQEPEDQRYTKKSLHFADLLDKMLALDPDKRLSAEDALRTHHFLAEPPVPARGAAERRR
mmetsp:Transcript_118165/g.329532  ORF Transcript_118165/g.329532 Transcript_118165/m.329532 type:complete len:609 (-) Transcript_118165:767-2593(-)